MEARDQMGQVEDLGNELEDSSVSPKEDVMDSAGDGSDSNDPLYVQKRLKQQQRSHKREMEQMRSEMQALKESNSGAASPTNSNVPINPYVPPASADPIEQHIHRAVSAALNHKEMEQRNQQEAASKQHVASKYQELGKHLDNMGDKYDDFDEVVRGNDVPITSAMRDAATILPKSGSGSAGEVLYKLGKNREELSRISKLHPHDQAAEMVTLSHALIAGGEAKPKGTPGNPLGNVKSNPVTNSVGVTEKTSPSEIRARMKAGKFK